MSKYGRFCKYLALLLLASTLAPTLAACQPADARTTAESFASDLKSREYPRIYSLLTDDARKDISLTALSQRYESIYGALGLTQSDCKLKDLKTLDANHGTATLTLTLTSEKLGKFQLDLEAPLLREGGKWRIPWTSEQVLPGLTDGCRALLRTIQPKRGEIFDANGVLLAGNSYAQSVYVDTSKVTNYETLIRLLAPELGMTEDAVRKKLAGALKRSQPDASASASPTDAEASPGPTATAAAQGDADGSAAMMYVVKSYPRDTLTDDQQEKLKAIEGVGVDESYMTPLRVYPYGDTLAHVLGYTATVSAEDLKKPENASLAQDALIGKLGLEKTYEQDLRGTPGCELVIVDADGATKLTLARKARQDGNDLRLSIDLRMQQRAEMQLMDKLTDQMAGTIIVLNPKTGYIEAMASYPSFDPNVFSFSITPDVMKQLEDPIKTPQINRATQGRYPPGSSFKPFTAAMGLEDGVITPSLVFPGKITNNRWKPTDKNWVYPPIKRMEATPGELNLMNAITYSDNIYFAYTAMQVGAASFYQHCLDLGLGATMDFELPLKTSQVANTDKFESLRTLADSGYGQGELLITPLQMAALFGSLDNGGDIMLPRLVQSLCATEGDNYTTTRTNAPEVWRENVVGDSIINTLLPDLKRVVTMGTASGLYHSPLKDLGLCAKTGTAEIGVDKSREIAWLITFSTEKRDELVCALIEVPSGKGGIRSEIVYNMLQPLPALADITAQDLANQKAAADAILNGDNKQ